MTTTTATTVEYKATANGTVDLHIDGAVVRQAIPTVRSRKAAEVLAVLLNEAVRLGAAYGPRDHQRELGDALTGRITPGMATYDLRPSDKAIVCYIDGREVVVVVPASLNLSRRVQLVRALGDAFEIGGEAR